jgi:hypothetical protein
MITTTPIRATLISVFIDVQFVDEPYEKRMLRENKKMRYGNRT